MFTSAECRAHAEQKLAQAEHDQEHRRRLITAAEAWLILASQLRRLESNFGRSDERAGRPPQVSWRPRHFHSGDSNQIAPGVGKS
jgi:hypothetical protein